MWLFVTMQGLLEGGVPICPAAAWGGAVTDQCFSAGRGRKRWAVMCSRENPCPGFLSGGTARPAIDPKSGA